MLKTHREKMLIRTANCDFNGTWRMSDILLTMQEVSGMHSELLGVGRAALIEKNLVWVLSRSEVKMARYPKIGETVTVETFPMANRRWFFPRYFIIYDEADQIIGCASSIWVLMDFKERKMAAPDAALPFLPDNSDLTVPLNFPGNIADVEGEARAEKRMPVYTDLDINGHVNNTKYADWLLDTIGIERMKGRKIAHLLIHYSHEVLPGNELALMLYQNERDFRLTGEHEQTRYFEIGGSFMAQ